jgi:hypothetical protein
MLDERRFADAVICRGVITIDAMRLAFSRRTGVPTTGYGLIETQLSCG